MTSQKQGPSFVPPETDKPIDILFIAGEHSGDEHAARLLTKLKGRDQNLNVAAIGGNNLAEAGAHLLYNPLENAVVGFIEVIKHFNYLKALFHTTLDWIAFHQPKVVCFVDYPGFNLRLAKQLFERGISEKGGGKVRLAYYISPQIWAWKSHRRFAMEKHLNTLGVIFPFEIDSYKDTNLPVEFVGHPFIEEDYESPIQHDPNGRLLLLPGSRSTPISRIFPVMLDTFKILRQKRDDLRAVVMFPTPKIRELLYDYVNEQGLTQEVDLVPNTEHISVKGVLTSSGPISLVCALAGVPGAIVYRTHTLTYWMAKILVKIRVIGIANIVLNRFIHPEFLQSQMKPSALATEIENQLDDPSRIAQIKTDINELRDKLTATDPMKSAMWIEKQLEAHM